jgi:hypothetical protein
VLSLAWGSDTVLQSVLAVGALFLSLEKTPEVRSFAHMALSYKQKTLGLIRRDLANSTGPPSDNVLIAILMLQLLEASKRTRLAYTN